MKPRRWSSWRSSAPTGTGRPHSAIRPGGSTRRRGGTRRRIATRPGGSTRRRGGIRAIGRVRAIGGRPGRDGAKPRRGTRGAVRRSRRPIRAPTTRAAIPDGVRRASTFRRPERTMMTTTTMRQGRPTTIRPERSRLCGLLPAPAKSTAQGRRVQSQRMERRILVLIDQSRSPAVSNQLAQAYGLEVVSTRQIALLDGQATLFRVRSGRSEDAALAALQRDPRGPLGTVQHALSAQRRPARRGPGGEPDRGPVWTPRRAAHRCTPSGAGPQHLDRRHQFGGRPGASRSPGRGRAVIRCGRRERRRRPTSTARPSRGSSARTVWSRAWRQKRGSCRFAPSRPARVRSRTRRQRTFSPRSTWRLPRAPGSST